MKLPILSDVVLEYVTEKAHVLMYYQVATIDYICKKKGTCT